MTQAFLAQRMYGDQKASKSADAFDFPVKSLSFPYGIFMRS
jgi:hypothetical protein